MKTLSYEFEIQKKGGHIVIEGLSNAATVDRMKELIDPSGWKLENYRKNPTVLFDHGKDMAFGSMPIGKALVCEVTDGGLYTKIQLSNSKTEKLTAIRDLVEEGILKTFSVGFNPIESDKSASNPDVTIIKSAELIECSIVPIPMNQDSTFAIAGKSMSKLNACGREWLNNWLHKQELLKKKAYMAAALHQRMDDMIAAKTFKDRTEISAAVQNEMKGSTAEKIAAIHHVLDGWAVELPVVHAFAKVLKLDKNFLVQIDSHGPNVITEIRDIPTEGVKAMDEATKKMLVHQIAVSKEAAESLEAATQMAQAAGYKVDKPSESDEGYVFEQIPADGLDLEAGQWVDLGNGARAHLAPAKVSEAPAEKPPEEQQQEEQKAMADQPKEELKPNTAEDEKAEDPAKQEQAEIAWDNFKAAVSQALQGEAEAMPDWMKQAFDAYQSALGEVNKLVGAPQSKNIDGNDDNPYHALAVQTNVLLGTLINEVKLMSSKMDGIADLSVKLATTDEVAPQEEEKPADTEDQQAKSIDMLARFRRDFTDIDTRLKRLNV